MNRNSNLQKSIKKAFEEHKEPLHEAQWDRLSVALGDKKPKRKFFPWLFGLIVVVGLAIGLGYWLGNSNSHMADMAVQQQSVNRNSASDDKSLSSAAQKNLSVKPAEAPSDNDNNNNNSNNTNTLNENEAGLNNKSTQTQSQNTGNDGSIRRRTAATSPSGKGTGSDKDNAGAGVAVQAARNGSAKTSDNGTGLAGNKGNENGGTNTGTDRNNGLTGLEPIKNDVSELITLGRLGFIKVADNTIYKKEDISEIDFPKHFVKTQTGGRDNDRDRGISQYRFAIGFTTGISRVEYKGVLFSDDSKMHDDTRYVNTQGNLQPSSTFANLFFDMKILKNLNLTFNSGIQYRQMQSLENITYKYNKVPFRDTTGIILGYLFVADTLNPQVFNHQSTHVTKFVSIPLTLGYTFPIGSMNEIQLNGGVVLNKITSVKGSTFSLNDAEVLDLRSRVSSKISLGYAGGLNYYRCIYGAWWIGGGIQMQQNKTVFDTPYGTIKSNNQITNYTFNLKYKF